MAHVRVNENQQPSPWNLARISSQPPLPVNVADYQYTYDGNACGLDVQNVADPKRVTIYILDDSVRMTHQEFAVGGFPANSRVRLLEDNVPDNNHGTFAAGIAAGATCGVAKKANIVWIAYNPFNILAPILEDQQNIGEWARPAVVNISNEFNPDIPELVAGVVGLIAAGIHVVIAVGNNHEHRLAPWKNPGPWGGLTQEDKARFNSIIWVGASSLGDTKWFINLANNFASSFGPIVDLFAPGDDIRSATRINNTSYDNYPGTSFAAPHVAGIIACLLSHPNYRNLSPEDMKTTILTMAEQNAITDVSVPNLLKPILKHELRAVITSWIPANDPNGVQLRLPFRQTALIRVTDQYADVVLLPQLNGITEQNRLQVAAQVENTINNTLQLVHIQQATVDQFTTTTRLASCRLDLWA